MKWRGATYISLRIRHIRTLYHLSSTLCKRICYTSVYVSSLLQEIERLSGVVTQLQEDLKLARENCREIITTGIVSTPLVLSISMFAYDKDLDENGNYIRPTHTTC